MKEKTNLAHFFHDVAAKVDFERMFSRQNMEHEVCDLVDRFGAEAVISAALAHVEKKLARASEVHQRATKEAEAAHAAAQSKAQKGASE